MFTIRSAIFFGVIYVFQSVVLSKISILGAHPDMLLTSVIVWGLMRGPGEGLIVGFITGFMTDIFSSGIYIFTFTRSVGGLLSGTAGARFLRSDDAVIMPGVFIISLLIYSIDAFTISSLQGYTISDLLIKAVISGAMNAALSVVIRESVKKLSASDHDLYE